MMKTISVASVSAISLLTLMLGAMTTHAQESTSTPEATTSGSACVRQTSLDEGRLVINPDLVRAKNLARQAAERANGGLGSYRAEASMHGPVASAPCVDNGNGSYTFSFTGSRPGDSAPFVESAVTVDTSTWGINVDYNGPVRAASGSSF